MNKTISRDPFARQELVRETVPKADRVPCHCCGRSGRFVYSIETDGGRTHQYPRAFCGVTCFRTYYDE